MNASRLWTTNGIRCVIVVVLPPDVGIAGHASRVWLADQLGVGPGVLAVEGLVHLPWDLVVDIVDRASL